MDKIDNEQLLHAIYDFLKQRMGSEQGQIWKSLTEDQKKEVYLSYQESENDDNLINTCLREAASAKAGRSASAQRCGDTFS